MQLDTMGFHITRSYSVSLLPIMHSTNLGEVWFGAGTSSRRGVTCIVGKNSLEKSNDLWHLMRQVHMRPSIGTSHARCNRQEPAQQNIDSKTTCSLGFCAIAGEWNRGIAAPPHFCRQKTRPRKVACFCFRCGCWRPGNQSLDIHASPW